MKKNIIIPFILASLISCAAIAIAGLYYDLSQSGTEISIFENTISQLQETITVSNNVLSDKENEIITIKKRLDESNQSYDSLQNNYDETKIELEQQLLLLSRVEKLEENKGNHFDETKVFKKIVYLTFDDGPSQRTLEVLDVLDEYSIKATFFVKYHRFAEENNIYNEIVKRGHSIGNHTYDHPLPGEDWNTFLISLFKMEDFIFKQTGLRTRIIRFPGGSKASWKYSYKYKKNVEALTDLGYVYFDWNISNHDSDSDMEYLSAEKMTNLVISSSRGRDMIMLLMHDRGTKYSMVSSLDNIIEYYKEQGYVFLPITLNSFNPQYFSTKDLE